MQPSTQEKVSGKLIRIKVERERWFAGVVFDGQRNINVSGPVSTVPTINSNVVLTGAFLDTKYGKEFKFTSCEMTIPTDRDGVVGFLKTVPHIGDVRARLIVDRLGLSAIDQILVDPECIRGIAQIGQKAIEAVRADIVSRKTLIECEGILSDMGIGPKTRRKLADEIGEKMVEIVRDNPYGLVVYEGIAFWQIDRFVMGRSLMDQDDPRRAAAISVEALKQCAEDGDTYADREFMMRGAKKLKLAKPIGHDALQDGIEVAINEGWIMPVVGGYALCKLAMAEANAANILLEWLSSNYELGSIELLDKELLDMLTDEQRQAIENGIKNRVCVITGGPGRGKCLDPETPIMMFDGTIRPIRTVSIGDEVMGIDSKPRTVVAVSSGESEMFQVTPVKGDGFKINENHVVSFKIQKRLRKDGREVSGLDFDIRHVPVRDLLSGPKRVRDKAKLFRVPVDFPEREVPLDPYMLGLWLGDGTASRPQITTPDEEIVEYIHLFAAKHRGLKVCATKNVVDRCSGYSLTRIDSTTGSFLLDSLRSLDLINNKHVPHVYKANSASVRALLLAGLLDTDGYLGDNGYEIITKYEQLRDDILFIARSLGLAAYWSEKTVKQYPGSVYYRVYISGDVDKIPLRVERKKARPRRQIKNVLHTGFSIESAGKGKYYGIEVDGDHMHLLGDFTVVHNTFVSKAILKSFGSASIGVVTPTGKAAKRASEVTGFHATTIHRFIGQVRSNQGSDAPKPIEEIVPQVTLVDEASMVDVQLFSLLLNTISLRSDARIVIVGDVDQLPSISAGRVLGDIIDSGVVPTARLTKPLRQAGDSPIVRNAYAINSGEVPDTASTPCGGWMFGELPDVDTAATWIKTLLTKRVPSLGLDPVKDVQILTGQKARELGANRMNELVRDILNPHHPAKTEYIRERTVNEDGKSVKRSLCLFRVGDKVMVTENDYELCVVNGDQGIVSRIEPSPEGKKNEDKVYVKLDSGDEVMFQNGDVDKLVQAWAVTVHKCVSLDTIVRTEKGYQTIADISDDGLIASPEGRLTPYTNKVVNIEQDMLKVATKDGYEIKITAEHGMDVWRSGEWCRVEGSDLCVGDILRMRLGEHDGVTEEPLLPEAPDQDVRAALYSIPTTMTPDLAELLGMIVADGTVFERGVRLAKRYVEDVDRFADLFMHLFGACVKRWEERNAFFAEVSSVHVASWLRVLGGMCPNEKHVPPSVMMSTSASRKAFLRGLFLDGSVHVRDGKLDHVEITTCSRRLAKEARTLLLAEGIACGTTNDTKPGITRIEIYGPFAEAFADNVGFHNSEKQRKASMPVGSYTRYSIPINYASYRDAPWPSKNHRQNASSRGRISRGVAGFIGAHDLLDYHYTPIRSIEPIRERSACVTVPDGHRFVQDGFCGWNSQGSEYPMVVVMCHDCMPWALQRALVYTAVTRAKKHVVMLSTKTAIAKAVKGESRLRLTRLGTLLATGAKTAGKAE